MAKKIEYEHMQRFEGTRFRYLEDAPSRIKRSNGKKDRYAKLLCDCGNVVEKSLNCVRMKDTKSCGCITKELPFEAGHKFEGTRVSLIGFAEERRVDKTNGQRRVKVMCECGTVFETRLTALTHKSTKSCGCLVKDSAKRRSTHGLSRTPAYRSYHAMKRRCYVESAINYKDYGGRGIKMCDRWLGEDGLLNFIGDMGQPEEGLSIDRIDVNKGYSPENCRWLCAGDQAYTRRILPQNRSGRTGVKRTHGFYEEYHDKYDAYITHRGVFTMLAKGVPYEEAVRAREEAEERLYGFIKDE